LELGNLGQLTNLHLISNQLTGPFLAFTGNLSNLDFLELAINQLTGPVPSTLGNLRSLWYLSFRSNHLEGNLDFLASIGNCRKLQILIFFFKIVRCTFCIKIEEEGGKGDYKTRLKTNVYSPNRHDLTTNLDRDQRST
ncbi:hypothetical protein BAE44_0025737, partial [Dichanthelium oligosanthes]